MKIVRQTLAEPVRFSGRGLHSGRPVQVTIHPGDNGIAFSHQGTRIRATPGAVTSTDRNTTLGSIATVEHLLSALSGLEITDAEIELSAPEVPAMDGSAADFVALLGNSQPLNPVDILLPDQELFLADGESWIRVAAGSGRWSYTFDYPGFTQTFSCLLPMDYITEVSRARTIAVSHEVAALQARGLGQGLDLNSVVLLGTGAYGNEPRYPDEPARHKLLDLIGDLALAGIPARHLDVTAHRTGHKMATRTAALLACVREGRRPTGGRSPDGAPVRRGSRAF